MSQEKPFLFGILTLAFIVLALLCLYQTLELSKSKAQLDKSTGHITMFTQQYQDIDFYNEGKMRFLKIDSYPEVFALSKYNSAFDRLDSLKRGDIISIYYGHNHLNSNDRVNYMIKYIDRHKNQFL